MSEFIALNPEIVSRSLKSKNDHVRYLKHEIGRHLAEKKILRERISKSIEYEEHQLAGELIFCEMLKMLKGHSHASLKSINPDLPDLVIEGLKWTGWYEDDAEEDQLRLFD